MLFLAELPAVIGLKLGASLSTLILLHSLANVIFLVACTLFAGLVLKDRRAVLLLALAQLIGLAHGLFCPVFELYYGVGLVLLFHATATNDHLNGWIKLAITTLLFVLALGSHPMAWALLLGSFILLDHRQRRPLIPTLAIISLVFAIVRGSSLSGYETAQFTFLQRLAFPSLVLDLFTPAALLDRTQSALLHFPDVLALSIFTTGVLWRNDRRRAVIIFLAGLVLLYVITGLYLPADPHDRYREQVYFAFAAWTLLVIMLQLWPLHNWRPAVLLLVILCVGFRMVTAERIAVLYTARTQWHYALIADARQQGLTKAIMDPGVITFGTAQDHVSPYWSTGVECLLLSAKEGPSGTVSVITTDDAEHFRLDEYPDIIVVRWDLAFAPDAPNARYFRFANSSYERLH